MFCKDLRRRIIHVHPWSQTNFTTFKAQDEACWEWAAERTYSNVAKITIRTIGGPEILICSSMARSVAVLERLEVERSPIGRQCRFTTGFASKVGFATDLS